MRDAALQFGALSALIGHLELDLLLRRVETTRLKVQDIHKDYIDVMGKGRCGGKPRTVSLVPGDSEQIIGRWLEARAQLKAQTMGAPD